MDKFTISIGHLAANRMRWDDPSYNKQFEGDEDMQEICAAFKSFKWTRKVVTCTLSRMSWELIASRLVDEADILTYGGCMEEDWCRADVRSCLAAAKKIRAVLAKKTLFVLHSNMGAGYRSSFD